MKKLILFILIITAKINWAQVGVLTPFPKAVFHVDGASDNPKDSPATSVGSSEELNDFIVNAQGQVGIGIIKPTTSTSMDIAISKGLRIPQLNSAAKSTLTTLINSTAANIEKAKGLLIFNTENNSVEFFNGQEWIALSL
ncbi:hypothetical protein O2K51_14450 [Apibacter raozihei]|uniref:hypothetical protein n=1 Tax=Apibacter raozihei TaxID=2500547 RepID=UPI000FE3340B|nr:hypothetical protein [Apibacter raozihei]